MFRLFKRKPKPKTNIQEALEMHLKNVKNNPDKTYIFIKYLKADNHIIFYSLPLEDNIVKINDVGYVVLDKCKYYLDYVDEKKEKYKILFTDLYEGTIVSYNPQLDYLSTDLNERISKNITDYLKQGLLEATLKRRENLKKTIIFIFLGIAAVYVILKLFKVV